MVAGIDACEEAVHDGPMTAKLQQDQYRRVFPCHGFLRRLQRRLRRLALSQGALDGPPHSTAARKTTRRPVEKRLVAKRTAQVEECALTRQGGVGIDVLIQQ